MGGPLEIRPLPPADLVVTNWENWLNSEATKKGRVFEATLSGASNVTRLTISLNNVNDSDANTATAVQTTMGVLIGDTTGDGTVNSGDVGQTKSKSGQAVDATNFRNDATADGTLNSGDVGLVKSKSGTALP